MYDDPHVGDLVRYPGGIVACVDVTDLHGEDACVLLRCTSSGTSWWVWHGGREWMLFTENIELVQRCP